MKNLFVGDINDLLIGQAVDEGFDGVHVSAGNPAPVRGIMEAIMRNRKPKTVRTIEAVVDERGRVRLLEHVRLPKARRAVVTLLDDGARINVNETALLSEPALAEDWNRPEEDEAWSHLQSER